MKKILVLSVALALIGSAVFAQGLTLSGNVKTGLSLETIKQDGVGSDTTFRVRSDDVHSSDPTALHMDLNGSYANEEETAGVNFRLRARYLYGGQSFDPAVRGAYGWVKFLDGVIRVDGGKYHDNLWGNSTISRHIDGKGLEDSLTGGRLVISPIEGLSFGWVAGATDNVLASLGSGLDGRWFFANNVVGARYKADVFEASVAYRMLASDPATGGFNDAGDELIFDIQVPISALKLDLQGHVTGLGIAHGADGKFTVDGTYTFREGFAAGLQFSGDIKEFGYKLTDGGDANDVGIEAKIIPHVLFAVSPSLVFYSEIDYVITPLPYSTKANLNHTLAIILRGMFRAGNNATITIGENITPLKYSTASEKNTIENEFFVDFIYNF